MMKYGLDTGIRLVHSQSASYKKLSRYEEAPDRAAWRSGASEPKDRPGRTLRLYDRQQKCCFRSRAVARGGRRTESGTRGDEKATGSPSPARDRGVLGAGRCRGRRGPRPGMAAGVSRSRLNGHEATLAVRGRMNQVHSGSPRSAHRRTGTRSAFRRRRPVHTGRDGGVGRA